MTCTYLWNDRTPENFIFHIKVYGALTGHGIDPKTLPKDIFNLLPEKDKTEKRLYIKESFILKAIAERFRHEHHDHIYGIEHFSKKHPATKLRIY